MLKLVLIRHGESTWNKENRFTGWKDVDLSDKGREEAREAGRILEAEGFHFDAAHTSVLKRAIRTLWIVLDQMDQMWLPVQKAWELNERHYGALQGLNKAETAEKFGEAQVKIWRRAYATPPPAMEKSDERWQGNDPRYAALSGNVPVTECLADTVARVVPYWHREIEPQLKAGKRLIIAAHGNSLRAIVKFLDGVSDDDIVEMNIPTGMPRVYELDEKTLKPIRSYYLGDPDKVKAAMEAVAAQGKKKT